MLRRFADARLRAVLRRTQRSREEAREDARTLRRRLAVRDREVTTLRVLVATWQGIARHAQDDLTAARAHDPMPGFPCGNPHCPCQAEAAAAIDGATAAALNREKQQ